MKSQTANHLWRQRLFEAEAGLTKFVVERHGGRHFETLLEVKRDIFSPFEDEVPSSVEWKRIFFRAQALMEKFVVGRFGIDELTTWAQSNGSVYGAIDQDGKRDAAAALERLERQAVLYDSRLHWAQRTSDRAELRIEHCAIWDYRDIQRAKGVPITLDSPCEYCVAATTSLINNKGLQARVTLIKSPESNGCEWTAIV